MLFKSICLFFLLSPLMLVAQKGTIIPDAKPSLQVNASAPNDILIWQISPFTSPCNDNNSTCYTVKENKIEKIIPIEDVLNLDFEEGNQYVVWTKATLKTPPISAYSGIYNYTIVKIVSKKISALEKSNFIPVTNNVNTIQSVQLPTDTASNSTASPIDLNAEKIKLNEEIEQLKKQMKEIKKQLEVMQLQLDMQLQLFQKKN